MRIAVSGGSGQIGHLVVRRLERDHQVVSFSREGESCWLQPERGQHNTWKCDVTDEEAVKDALWTLQPDAIIHLAAISTVKADTDQPCRISLCNVVGTHHLLEHAPQGCRFVLASSATVYGNNTSRSMPADECTATAPTSVYAATKLAQESLVNAYTALGRISGCSLRLCASVGPGSRHGLLHDVVRKLRLPTQELELIGCEPGSVKPFLYADDMADAFAHFIEKEKDFSGHCNICPANSITVETVAKLAMRVLGIHKPICWLGQAANWAGDNPQVHVRSRYVEALGWRPRYGTSEAAVTAALQDIARGL